VDVAFEPIAEGTFSGEKTALVEDGADAEESERIARGS
jgi:hypothetical protein